MPFKSLDEVIDAPPVLPKRITEETRKITLEQSHCHRGSVRIALGRFYTDDEYEARRKRILETPLP